MLLAAVAAAVVSVPEREDDLAMSGHAGLSQEFMDLRLPPPGLDGPRHPSGSSSTVMHPTRGGLGTFVAQSWTDFTEDTIIHAVYVQAIQVTGPLGRPGMQASGFVKTFESFQTI